MGMGTDEMPLRLLLNATTLLTAVTVAQIEALVAVLDGEDDALALVIAEVVHAQFFLFLQTAKELIEE